MADMTIEIWSDLVCSWCYIGKRHLERALEAFPERDQVTIRWRSFELDPGSPADAGTADEELARRRSISLDQAREMHEQSERQGADLGIAFDCRRARRGNTFDAHRVLHMAADADCQESFMCVRRARWSALMARPTGSPACSCNETASGVGRSTTGASRPLGVRSRSGA